MPESLQSAELPVLPEKRDKPVQCYLSGCPLAKTAKGFVLGTGDPTKAKLAICLEAPGNEEIGAFTILPPTSFSTRRFFSTPAEGKIELALRRRDYPEMEEKFIRFGAPTVGMTGHEIFDWILRGMKRDENIFIDNTLRCLPPKRGNSEEHYPKGDDRIQAEHCCRQYDRWHLMKPDVAVVTLHPASLLRDTTPLSLQAVDFQKAQDFIKAGHSVVLLAGGKSVKMWLGGRENTTFWRGDYALLDRIDFVPRMKFVKASEAKKGKGKRVKLSEEEKAARKEERKMQRKGGRGIKNPFKGTIFDLGGK